MNPQRSAGDIADELRRQNIANVSRVTVSRRLHECGLYGRAAVKKPFISKKNKRARLEFAREYLHWTSDEWKNVAFSDETKFNLVGSDGRQYVRRPRGARNNVRYQMPTVKFGGGSVMVWGVFSAYGVGPLVRINERMTGIMYRDILRHNLLQYGREKMAPGWIFQHDNDPKHKSAVVTRWLQSNEVRVLKWPAQSPDLNPIENLWQEVKRRLKTEKPRNFNELYQKVTQHWQSIPQDRILALINSMPRRCSAVISAKGMATKY